MSCSCGRGNGCNCSDISGIDVRGCQQGCCDNTAAVPSQFINRCAAPALEEHCVKTVVENFYATLKISNEWNIPACGGTAILNVKGLKEVSIGSYIWNSQYGYFQITGFNASLEQLTVQNNCTTGNAAVGTTINSCSDFIVTDAPQSANSNNPFSIYPYVAIDFTAPNNGDCILITLTNVNGLVAGKPVQIGSGTYRLDSVDSATTATICNDGAGITPGTSVIAKNLAGEYQYPVILIDANPCTNPVTYSGPLLACDGGVTKPLTGIIAGSTPVLIDTVTGEVEFQKLDLPIVNCTVLSADLTLVNGTATYTITIADSSIFAINDLISIAGVTGYATVDTIIDANHIDVTIVPTPSALQNVDSGAAVCSLTCCDAITAEFGGPLTPCSNFENKVDAAQTSAAITNVDLNNANPLRATGYAAETITNPSSCRNMLVMISYIGRVFGAAVDANTNTLDVEFSLVRRVDAGADVALVNMNNVIYMPDDASNGWDTQRVWTEIITLTPGEAHSYSGKMIATKNGSDPATYHIDNMDVFTSYLAVAV